MRRDIAPSRQGRFASSRSPSIRRGVAGRRSWTGWIRAPGGITLRRDKASLDRLLHIGMNVRSIASVLARTGFEPFEQGVYDSVTAMLAAALGAERHG